MLCEITEKPLPAYNISGIYCGLLETSEKGTNQYRI